MPKYKYLEGLTPEEQQVVLKQKEMWQKRHDMPDEDYETFMSSPFHMRLALRSDEIHKYKMIAEVVKSKYCNAGLKVGQKLVFSVLPGRLLPDESDCPLCVKALAPVAASMKMAWERLVRGDELDPNICMFPYVQCEDPGIERGGLGNVLFNIRLEKAE